jgi:hypothetical protein
LSAAPYTLEATAGSNVVLSVIRSPGS